MGLSFRDWALEKLSKCHGVKAVEPVGDRFIHIIREEYPSFTSAIISEKTVSRPIVNEFIGTAQDFEFISNIPKAAKWSADAIAVAKKHTLGWGGFGDLMSAIGQEIVTDFQRKEYEFVEFGLYQHSKVIGLTRIYDRVFKIHRAGSDFLTVVLINEYELTAEHVRYARETYGDFDEILKTNPNGGTTSVAQEVASNLGVSIFSWGEFLRRLHKP